MKFASHKGKWFLHDALGWIGADGAVAVVPASAKFYATLTDAKAAGFNPSPKQAEFLTKSTPAPKTETK